ncbi:MAG: sigma-54-dependent Fis family transcriptional regulator, partial [Firmicutes bacterium]|nr:sigma-54-dependent Fis family transcriptional regulator [Bacillota bacterium]
LKQMVREKQFRADLYYRLHILTLNIPPLRVRKEDITALLHFFLREYCHKFKKNIHEIEPAVLDLLGQYNWPGNVRELKNTVERLVLLADGPVITAAMVREILADQGLGVPEAPAVAADAGNTGDLLNETERVVIERVLAAAGGNRTEAARRLGIGRTTLWRRLKGLQKPGVS